ncbi:MAG: sensor histidine kinase [Oscillospiraceae bacterium]
MNVNLTDIKTLYKDSMLKAVVTDNSLKVLWCNEAALSVYPSLKLPDGFNMLFQSEMKEELLKTKTPKEFNLSSLNLSIIATPLAEGLLFVLTDIIKNDGADIYSKTERLLVNPISTKMRMELSEIFTSVSTIANISECEDNEKIYDISKSINTNCYALLRISNLLSSYFAKLKPSPCLEELIDLKGFLQNICSASGVISIENGVVLSFSTDCDEALVKADSSSISESILNLLSNACKFSSDGGEIDVKLIKHEKTATIIIKDHGIGIPPHILPNVFEPFFSYTHDNTPFSGLGLGLTLARLNILSMGGTLSLTSKDYDGTSAIISLPLCEDFGSLTLKSPPTLSSLLRDRFSQLHVLLADCGRVPLP